MNDKLEELEQELEEIKNKCAEIEEKIKCAEIEEKINELKRQESEVRWRAKFNEIFYYSTSYGEICADCDGYCNTENGRYTLGNYFKTEEEAKNVVEKIKIYTQLKDLALRLNKGEKIDWDDFMQNKYCIGFNHPNNTLMRFHANALQNIGQIYCLDRDFLEVAKKEIGEENLKKLFE